MALAVLFRVLEAMGLGVMRVGSRTVSGSTVFGLFIWLLYLRFIVPVLGVFYGTSLIADEVEDKTITYLFTRPIPRGAVLVGKYLAYLVATAFVVLPSVMLVYFLMVPASALAATFPVAGHRPGAAGHRAGCLRGGVRLDRGPAQVPAGHRPHLRLRVGAGGDARARAT